MSYHDVEVADSFDNCCLRCTCSEECTGSTWEEAGRKFDEHVNDAGVHEDGEQ